MHKLSVSVCKLNLGPSLRPLLNRRFSRMVTKASVAEKNIAVIGSSRGIGLEVRLNGLSSYAFPSPGRIPQEIHQFYIGIRLFKCPSTAL